MMMNFNKGKKKSNVKKKEKIKSLKEAEEESRLSRLQERRSSSSSRTSILTSSSVRLRGQPISLPLSNPIQSNHHQPPHHRLSIHIQNNSKITDSPKEEEEEEEEEERKSNNSSSNSSIYSTSNDTTLNQTTLTNPPTTSSSNSQPPPPPSNTTTSTSTDLMIEECKLSESKSDDLEIYIQKVLDRIRQTSNTLKSTTTTTSSTTTTTSSSSSPSPSNSNHHQNQIQNNNKRDFNKLKKTNPNRSSIILLNQKTTTTTTSQLNHNNQLHNQMNLSTTQLTNSLNLTNLTSSDSNHHHQLINHHHTSSTNQSPTHTNSSSNPSSPTTSNSFSLSSISRPDPLLLSSTNPSSISKPDQHFLAPTNQLDQLSSSSSPSASDHELASLYAKYQSSSNTTTTTHSIGSSSSSSSNLSSNNNSTTQLDQALMPVHSSFVQPIDSYQLEDSSESILDHLQDSNQSPDSNHQSPSTMDDPNQTLRFDSDSFHSSPSLQNQSQVFDELNLMLGEAIDSAHSDFNNLHITHTSPFLQQAPPNPNPNPNPTHSTKDEQMPVSTSYSSLLSSVKRKINANKVEHSKPLQRKSSRSPKKLSFQEALLSFDESQADELTITSSTSSSLSEYSVEKQGKDCEEDEEKVEISDRLTPLPIPKPLSYDESEEPSLIPLDQASSSSSTSVSHDSNQQSPMTRVRTISPTKLPSPSKIPISPSRLQPQSPSTPIPINSYPQLISSTISRPIDTTPTKSSISFTQPTTRHPQTSPIHLNNNQSSPNLGQIRPRKSLLISRSSSESSQLNQWQWLESNPSSEIRGPSTHPSLSTVETGPIKQESMSRSERRLKLLDHHYRSQLPKERSPELLLKLNLLNHRQKWLNECITTLSKHQTSKSKTSSHLPSPPSMMKTKQINHKQMKKIKSSVERCRIYATTINEMNSEPVGLDLWIWFKTHGVDVQQSLGMESTQLKHSNRYPTHLQNQPIRSSYEQVDLRQSSISSSSALVDEKGSRPLISKLNYVPNITTSPPIPPLSPIPHHLQAFHSPHPNCQPHSRDVSSGSSSVVSFPVRSDAVKAIEITEKKGTPQLMEIVHGGSFSTSTSGATPTISSASVGGMNPLIQVDNLPFPGLYHHGKSGGVGKPMAAVDFSTFSFKPPNPTLPVPVQNSMVPHHHAATATITGGKPVGSNLPPPPPNPPPNTTTTRSGGFLSQLTRRNSHKKSSLGMILNASSSANLSTGLPTSHHSKIGKISGPLSSMHTSTGAGMMVSSGLVGTVKGPRPLRKLSQLGSTPPAVVVRERGEREREREKRREKRNSIEVGNLVRASSKFRSASNLRYGGEVVNDGGEEREGEKEEIEVKLKRLLNVLPLASKDELREILWKENGDDVAAIGTYLEQDRRKRNGI